MLYYRRHLPHWIPDGKAIFVTWRVAGSAPPSRPETLTAENTGRNGFARKDKALDSSSTGPFWLRNPRIARTVENAVKYGETSRGFYSLYAWVIMPNHVHVVLEPKAALPNVMRWLKGRTGRSANRILGRTGMPFWQDESYDHWIRSGKELEETIAYVENNPVDAGLVECAEQWLWSSARFRADDRNRCPTGVSLGLHRVSLVYRPSTEKANSALPGMALPE
jgi:REP element-mobilizing transposase RayT